MYFKNKDEFASFKKDELKKYGRFLEVIRDFMEHYKLNNFSLREIDIYLWLSGKKHFPNRY